MITKIYSALKKWALPLVIVYTLVLTVASFMNLKDIPDIGISHEDKVFHVLAYFVMALLVYNYLRTLRISRILLLTVITVTTYGIIIEVLQYVLTTHRSFDLYDALANFIGAVMASFLLKLRLKRTLNLD